MRTLRVFVDAPLAAGSSQILANETAHHLRTVLRIKPGQSLQVFNGKGGYFDANITACNKKQVSIELGQHHEVDNESPLAITLLQGISRGQKMDLAMQKAVEEGPPGPAGTAGDPGDPGQLLPYRCQAGPGQDRETPRPLAKDRYQCLRAMWQEYSPRCGFTPGFQ